MVGIEGVVLLACAAVLNRACPIARLELRAAESGVGAAFAFGPVRSSEVSGGRVRGHCGERTVHVYIYIYIYSISRPMQFSHSKK